MLHKGQKSLYVLYVKVKINTKRTKTNKNNKNVSLSIQTVNSLGSPGPCPVCPSRVKTTEKYTSRSTSLALFDANVWGVTFPNRGHTKAITAQSSRLARLEVSVGRVHVNIPKSGHCCLFPPFRRTNITFVGSIVASSLKFLFFLEPVRFLPFEYLR